MQGDSTITLVFGLALNFNNFCPYDSSYKAIFLLFLVFFLFPFALYVKSCDLIAKLIKSFENLLYYGQGDINRRVTLVKMYSHCALKNNFL